MTKSILFVDAYDSFSRNIIALLYNCVVDVKVTTVKIDTDIQQEFGINIEPFFSSFDVIALGPGPGDPRNDADVGLFKDVWNVAARQKIPVLGICLGFQSLCLQYGLSVVRMDMPCHGQTKLIRSNMLDVFKDVSDVISMNYNSIGVKTSEWLFEKSCHLSADPGADSGYSSDSSSQHIIVQSDPNPKDQLELLAWDDEGYAMAVKHVSLPFWGLQFHPESCMSNEACHEVVRNWWSKTVAHNVTYRHSIQPLSLLGSFSDVSYSKNQNSSTKSEQNHGICVHQTRKCDRNTPALGWSTLQNSGLTMDDLSYICHEPDSTDTVALLESTAKGRYCIYALTNQHSKIASYMNGQLTLSNGISVTSMHSASPIEAFQSLEETTKSYSISDGNPNVPFWGGYIGYISYEMSLDILHDTPTYSSVTNERVVPDFRFVFVERSVVLDKETGNIYIQSIVENDQNWIDTTRAQLLELGSIKAQNPSIQPLDKLERILSSTTIKLPSHSTYTTQIRTCQSHLHAGNSYELCLTTEAVVTTPIDNSETPYLLYRNLNKHNPVPFASYLHFPSLTHHSHSKSRSTSTSIPSTTILSTSPEQFLSWSRNGTLDMIPMKGTVPRLTPTSPSLSEATAILRNAKESAENLMIADLIRHDLHGIVGCKPYTPSANQSPKSPVEIVKLNEITPYATVYQLTSHIRAQPPATIAPNDTKGVITHNHSSLQHTLPPGSMTGAPKRRSCQILREEIERRNRGVYSGVIGYMDVGGGGCWSVAIRTAWSSGAEDFEDGSGEDVDVSRQRFQKWHVGAGGAVTVLSNVQGEWEEMMGKLRSVLKGFRTC